MAASQFNLLSNVVIDNVTYDYSIEQGETYILTFSYPGDLTSGTLRGQIRNKYAEEEDDILYADFEFGDRTYSGTPPNDTTEIVVTLSATATAAIPSTKYQGKGVPNIKNCWVYDIEWESTPVVDKILKGFVQVNPEVTV